MLSNPIRPKPTKEFRGFKKPKGLNKLPNLKYGNCLLGVIIIRCVKGPGQIIFKKQRGSRIPHLMFRLQNGTILHYKKVRDILPGLLTILWFEGKFEEYKKKK